MKARFFLAFLLLLISATRASAGESFPAGDVFRPLVADPIEPRNFISVLSLDTGPSDLTVGSVGLGTNFGLYRWAGQQRGDGWQVGIFASINSQFDLEESSYPLINTDFRVGIPVSFRRGEFSGRARLFHQSSHLGDELILQGLAPPRVDLSVEIVDLVLAWERAGWRIYGGGLYMVSRDPEDLDRSGLQVGVDYVGTSPVLFGGRLVGGLDIRKLEENDWNGGYSAKVGLEYGRRQPDHQLRGITVLLEYFDGPAPFGQFYVLDVSYYGLAMQFHF